MTASMLRKMSEIDIKSVDVSTLVNMQSVNIDSGKDACTKLAEYINQIGNPYCFLVGDTPVKISFSETGKALDNVLLRYFISLKQ